MRLRAPLNPVEMQVLYPRPHDHRRWADHLIRVDETVALARDLIEIEAHRKGGWKTDVVADLSCGNASIARALCTEPILGDFAPGYPIVGPIEETVLQLPRDEIDLFVLSETLEHLNDPDMVLRDIRAIALNLILSTPVGAFGDTNAEHIWAWDADEVRQMLNDAGWEVVLHEVLEHPAGGIYSFGLWGCR